MLEGPGVGLQVPWSWTLAKKRRLVGPRAKGQLGARDAAQRGGGGWSWLPREAGGRQFPASPAVRLAHLEPLSPYYH